MPCHERHSSSVRAISSPSGLDWPIAGLSVPLDEVAALTGLKTEIWNEDGLGTARGRFIKLPSGRVVLLREMVHAIERLGKRGPDMVADGADVISTGIERLIAEVLMALNLTDAAIDWRMHEGATKHVADVLEAYARSDHRPIKPRQV